MVCKTCGAYNAENLTNCKVCGAKLKSSERNENIQEKTVEEPAPVISAEEFESEQKPSGRPQRHFTSAPVWPTKAFNGPSPAAHYARTAQQAAIAAQAAEAKEAPAPAEEPVQKAEPAAEPEAPQDDIRFCMNCGKKLIPGALFCPYCGTNNAPGAFRPAAAAGTAAAAAAVTAAAPAEKPVAPAKVHEPSKKAYDRYYAKKAEEDLFSDEDLDDISDKSDDVLEEDDFTEKKASASRSWFKSRKNKPSLDDDIEELDDFGSDDDDAGDEEDDEYDDEYYDQEFDDDEPDKKKKGSTILFIVLIIVLLALIAFFATYLLKKNGGSLFGGAKTKPAASDVVESDPGTVQAPVSSPDDLSATIEETESNGVPMFTINVHAPTGSKVRLISKAQLENDTVPITQDNQVSIRVPREVFLPGDYCESTTVTVTPQLEITLPSGEAKTINVPSATVTVPQVSLILETPETSPVEANPDGSPIEVKGTVTDHTVEVSINGENVQVYEGGIFSGSYTPVAGQDDSIVVVARKVNCVTATATIEVTPYVVKDMEIVVTSSGANLTASSGRVLVEGTAPSGATIVATCDDSGVTCGDVLVADGRFTCNVTVKDEGCYKITFNGTAEGYNDGSTSCVVENKPTVKSSTYKSKALNVSKNYQKLVEGKANDAKQLTFTGKVKEIASDTPYVIFRMEDSAGNSVYVCNRSERNTINNDDIGKKKTVAGYNAGLYEDSGALFIWGWFIWND